MLHWLICTSSSRALAALSLVTVFARADTVPAAVDVRPPMAVTVDIQGNDYTQLLPAASRDSLMRFMHDSLRSVLERNFGFLNWRSATASHRDTLHVRWIQRSTAPQDGLLELSLRGPTIGVDSSLPPLLFEKWARLQTRLWQPKSVTREWTATVDTLFKRQRADLVAQLFGRMPLQLVPVRAHVQLMGQNLSASVGVRADQISAADQISPEFVVRVTVKDTVPPRSIGDGAIELRQCLRRLGASGYACQMGAFVYREDTTSAADRHELLKRVILEPQSLHLLRYQPATVATGPGGTVMP